VVEDLRDGDDECDGLTHFNDRLIEIHAGLKIPEQYQVLFHELMHAGLAITGTKTLTNDRDEELIIRAIEYSVWPVLKQIFMR
jgi:hypothetical protein